MSLILSSSFVSVFSGEFASDGGVVSFGLPAGLIVTSNMAPARPFSASHLRIFMVSFWYC